jgi:hypothetical protein
VIRRSLSNAGFHRKYSADAPRLDPEAVYRGVVAEGVLFDGRFGWCRGILFRVLQVRIAADRGDDDECEESKCQEGLS